MMSHYDSALLEDILDENRKQTALLEKINNTVKPPLVLDGGIPEKNKELLMNALESLEKNEVDL